MQSIENFLEIWNKRDLAQTRSLLANSKARVYNNLNVTLTKSASNDYTVRINYIESIKRRKGEMKKFLQWLIAQADKGGFNLSMAVQPAGRHYEDTPSKEKLKEITERFGFTVRFEYPDGLGYEMMRSSIIK